LPPAQSIALEDALGAEDESDAAVDAAGAEVPLDGLAVPLPHAATRLAAARMAARDRFMKLLILH